MPRPFAFRSVFSALVALSFSAAFAAPPANDAVVSHPTYETALNPQQVPEEAIELSGLRWQLAVGDRRGGGPARTIRASDFKYTLTYGFAAESELSEIKSSDGKQSFDYEKLRDPSSTKDVLWYKKRIFIPNDWSGGVLRLEALDYSSEIYFNGAFLQAHEGGHAPIEVDVGAQLGKGRPDGNGAWHEIVMRVEDDRMRRDIAVGKQERKLWEGVIFYGNSSGAWKGAELRKVGPAYIASVRNHATSTGVFTSTLSLKGNLTGLQARARLIDRASGKSVAEGAFPIANRKANVKLQVEKAKLWSPENPNLYDVQFELLRGAEVVELIKSYAGFASFKQKYGMFWLNDSMVYLRGILNQMVFPKGLYTPDSPTDNAHDIRMMIEHGFNFQRVHNTTPSPQQIYEMQNGVIATDPFDGKTKRMGVGWALEMPTARDLRSARSQSAFLKQWGEIVRAYGHGHPGLWYFVAGNEDWGFLEDNDHAAAVRDEVRERYQLKLLQITLENAPEGAVVSVNDGWRQITGVKNGVRLKGVNIEQILLSAHDYAGAAGELMAKYGFLNSVTDHAQNMPRNGKDLLLKDYDFIANLQAFVIGELGGKSYAQEGVENVFSYGEVYRNLHRWMQDSTAQLRAMGKLDIVAGYVYTQLRDAGNKPHIPNESGKPTGELNGILTADGHPKGDPKWWAAVNRDNQADRVGKVLTLLMEKGVVPCEDILRLLQTKEIKLSHFKD